MATFAQNVRAERMRRDYSQEEVAERAGVHRTYVGMVELCAKLMAAMAASDTWWTPTLQVLRMSALAGNREFREDPHLRYIPFVIRAGL